ncbi:MAG: VWA domain-containing protein [Dehalococcoidia bacterium]|jgi:hypothetical protein|nr:VWA domain-containing protein [Dehalococcoidia bacterium]
MTPLTADDGALTAFAAEAPGARRGALAENVLAFAALLREGGLPVTTGRAVEAARALERVDLLRRDDVEAALAATLVSNIEQRPLFDALFSVFWSAVPMPEPTPMPSPDGSGGRGRSSGPAALELRRAAAGDLYAGASADGGAGQPHAYSEADLVTKQDFAGLRGGDLQRVRRLIQQLAPQLRTAESRRRRTARHGRTLDLRHSLRRAARRGGELHELVRQRRRERRTDVVLLADVSGSMDLYSEFLVQFVYGLQQELRGVSTFVFSTRLFEVTAMLRARSFSAALRLLEESVDGWSSGTQIGESLRVFNQSHAAERVHRRTVVIVLSDGWDRGDAELVGLEMQRLQRRAKRVIWLNPLLGHAGYEPLCEGMAAALPYCDDFLPANDVESLRAFGRHLLSVAAD